MRYRLRTLLVVLALAPPLLAWGWMEYGKYRQRQRQREVEARFWQYSQRMLKAAKAVNVGTADLINEDFPGDAAPGNSQQSAPRLGAVQENGE